MTLSGKILVLSRVRYKRVLIPLLVDDPLWGNYLHAPDLMVQSLNPSFSG